MDRPCRELPALRQAARAAAEGPHFSVLMRPDAHGVSSSCSSASASRSPPQKLLKRRPGWGQRLRVTPAGAHRDRGPHHREPQHAERFSGQPADREQDRADQARTERGLNEPSARWLISSTLLGRRGKTRMEVSVTRRLPVGPTTVLPRWLGFDGGGRWRDTGIEDGERAGVSVPCTGSPVCSHPSWD